MMVQPPITIPSGVDPSQVSIESDGTVQAGSQKLGKISLVDVPAPDGLVANGDSVFSATAASGAIKDRQERLAPAGRARGLDVNMGTEMSQMMAAQQQYAMGSQAIQYQSQMLQIANEIKP